MFPVRNCPFPDCSFSGLFFFCFRIVIFRIVLFQIRCFLFRIVLFKMFPFQNCPFSDLSFSELSLFRFVLFEIVIFQIFIFQSCPFLVFPFQNYFVQELSSFRLQEVAYHSWDSLSRGAVTSISVGRFCGPYLHPSKNSDFQYSKVPSVALYWDTKLKWTQNVTWLQYWILQTVLTKTSRTRVHLGRVQQLNILQNLLRPT